MTGKYTRLHTVMKMYSFPSSLTFAPIKFVQTKNDVLPVLLLGKHYRILSVILAIIITSIYFKVKVYDTLKIGKDFFLYIRSLSTFIEIVCLVGNMLCCNFGARKTVRIYKKVKKMVKINFSDTDYKNMSKLYLFELLIAALLLSIQFFSYCYLFQNFNVILIFILDSNITVLSTATILRHYNVAIIFKICIENVFKSFKGTVNSKQLKQVWSSYLDVYGVVKSNNEFFGIGLSCTLAVLYVYCLVALFGICTYMSSSPQNSLPSILWFCTEMSRILLVVIGTCMCEVKIKELHARLGCYDGEENHLDEVSLI